MTDEPPTAALVRRYGRERRAMTDGGQATFDERGRPAKPPAAHLTGTRPTGAAPELSASKPREWWCNECNARVTRTAGDADGEYGHADDCPHKFTAEVGE